MPLTPLPLNEELLKLNYEFWMQQWTHRKEPSVVTAELASRVFGTHTFPYQKTFENGITVIPLIDIFHHRERNHCGLLSDGYRAENGLIAASEQSRKMNTARAINLNNYVFTYLSIHDPYYGKNPRDISGVKARPFGIFVKKEIETFAYCIPSRRDINDNDEVDAGNIMREFLLPDQARSLLSYQIANDKDHKGDFWHYYGSPEYWFKDEVYALNSWKKRFELHYFEKVEIKDFAAVLWPLWYDVATIDGVRLPSETHNSLDAVRAEYPDCAFIPYWFDKMHPMRTFIEASWLTIRYYLEFGYFPPSEDVARQSLT